MRIFHKYFGVGAGLFLLVLSITGVLLNHVKVLDGRDDPFIVGVTAFGVHPTDKSVKYLGTHDGLFKEGQGGFDRVKSPYPMTDIVAVDVNQNGSVLVAIKRGALFELSSNKGLWRRHQLPFEFNTLLGATYIKDGFSVASDQGIHYFEFPDEKWQINKVGKPPFSWRTFLINIHTGYGIGQWLVGLYDMSALILIGLMISGLFMFFRKC